MSGAEHRALAQGMIAPPRAGRVVFKYAAALFGQASLSLFHFGLNVVLVRRFEPHDYGVFALAFVAAMMGASLTNALAGTPVSVYTPGLSRRAPRLYLETLLSTVNVALVGGVLLITLLTTLAMHFPARTMLAFSAFVALYSARQYSRSLGFARRAPHVVLSGDLAYIGVSLLLVAVAGWSGASLDLTLVLGALALGNLAAIGLELQLLTGGRLRLLGWRSLRRYGDIWRQSRWALIGAVTTLIASQAHSFIVSVLSGPAAYAPLAAGFVLFGPVRIGLQSWLSVMRPEMSVAVARQDRSLLQRIQKASTLIMVAGMALFGAALYLFWGPIDAFLYASRYSDAPMGWIVAGWCAVTLFTTLAATPSGVLQSCKAFRVLAMGTVYGAMLSLLAVAVLVLALGPLYSLLGILLAEAFLAGYLALAVNREVSGRW